jgi:hypothetical protein
MAHNRCALLIRGSQVTYDTLMLHRQETSPLPQRAGDERRADITIIVVTCLAAPEGGAWSPV